MSEVTHDRSNRSGLLAWLIAAQLQEKMADDVIRIEVQPTIRAMAAQSIIAGTTAARAKGHRMKVICGGKA